MWFECCRCQMRESHSKSEMWYNRFEILMAVKAFDNKALVIWDKFNDTDKICRSDECA